METKVARIFRLSIEKVLKMKKRNLLIIFAVLFYFFVPAFAQEFAYLEDLTAVQKQKLSQIDYSYEQERKSLEMRILSYQDKLDKVKEMDDKSIEQINLLVSAYERNIKTLQVLQNQLKQKTEESYKTVMTPKQYKQYLAQQLQVENEFSDFIKK